MTDKTFGSRIDGITYIERQGAYLIAVCDGKLATVRTPKGYLLLGGGIEDKETHVECIRRECLEESGYAVSVGEYICSADTYKLHYRLGYFHPIQYYYQGKILDKVAEPTEADHVFEWLPLEDLERKMYVEQQIWAVKYYIENYLNQGK